MDEDEEKKEDVQEKTETMPRKAGNPITNKKCVSFTRSDHLLVFASHAFAVVTPKNTSLQSQLSSGVASPHPAPFIPLSVLLLQDPHPDRVAQHLHQQTEGEREAGKPKRTRPLDRQQTRCLSE